MPENEIRDWDYCDSWPTCMSTFSILMIFSDSLDPEKITEILKIEPTRSFQKGEIHTEGSLQRKCNGWFYSTETLCDSKDPRRHIDIIIELLENERVWELQKQGCKLEISSFWNSIGQGGPELMPDQMLKLGRMGIPVSWDVHFADKDEREGR